MEKKSKNQYWTEEEFAVEFAACLSFHKETGLPIVDAEKARKALYDPKCPPRYTTKFIKIIAKSTTIERRIEQFKEKFGTNPF